MASKQFTVSKLLTVLLTAHPSKQTEFLQTLEALGRDLASVPGCIECVVAKDVGGGPRFVLFMAFRDQKSLEAQLGSESFRILRGAMDILSEPAEFRVVSADARPGFSP
jgi:quinol monooxygenase YgiN